MGPKTSRREWLKCRLTTQHTNQTTKGSNQPSNNTLVPKSPNKHTNHPKTFKFLLGSNKHSKHKLRGKAFFLDFRFLGGPFWLDTGWIWEDFWHLFEDAVLQRHSHAIRAKTASIARRTERQGKHSWHKRLLADAFIALRTEQQTQHDKERHVVLRIMSGLY